MEINLVFEGLRFMVLGMSSVFGFLIVLVLILKLQASLLGLISPKSPSPKAIPSPKASQDDSELAAVIAIAINKFKEQK